MKESTGVVCGVGGGEGLEELLIAVLVPLLEHEAERLLVKDVGVEGVGGVWVWAERDVVV